MKRTIVKVYGIQFCGDARAVEKHLKSHPGILQAMVNPISGVAVVDYDESRVTGEEVGRLAMECGYHCRIFWHGRAPGGARRGT